MINFKKYGKRCLSLFLAASMILMPAVQTFAEEETAATGTGNLCGLCNRYGYEQWGSFI